MGLEQCFQVVVKAKKAVNQFICKMRRERREKTFAVVD